MNNTPFKIGDRVVRIGPSVHPMKKGEVYTVAGLYRCKCDPEWCIYMAELPSPIDMDCPVCMRRNKSGLHSALAKNFALAQPRHEDAAIDESILEQARELIGVRETVAPVGEPINK